MIVKAIQQLMRSASENLSISRKVLYIVFVPVVVELFFGITILVLLGQAEREVAEELHSKKVLYACGLLQKSLMTGVVAAFEYTVTKSAGFQNAYTESKKGCQESVAEILTLTQSDAEEFAAAKQFEAMVIKTLKQADDACRLYCMGGSKYSPLNVIQIKLDISAATEETVAALSRIKQVLSKRGASQRHDYYRTLLKNSLITGMCGNVLLGLFLARIVSESISARLNVIARSTHLVRKGQQLPPALSGTDDVAKLDCFIHEMVEELNVTHQREQAVIEQAADAIVSCDTTGKILRANPAAAQLWGHSPEKLLSMNIMDLVTERDSAILDDTLKKALSGAEKLPVEVSGNSASERQLSLSWSVSKELEGNRLFCIVHDVTERKMLEQLRRDFVAMISHDLRSPLTSLRCTLNLFEEGLYGDLSPAGVAAVKKSDRETDRLIRLISTLLDYEKFQSGQFDLICSSESLENIIQQSLDSVERLAELSGVSLKFNGANFKVIADRDKIIQVLVNLLSNAIKFSQSGSSVEICVILKNDFVEISVNDHGKGIPHDQQGAIFEKYRQVKGDGQNQKGTGLGLSIAKLIVESHRGQIGVTSSPGEGSKFWFTLPLSNEFVAQSA